MEPVLFKVIQAKCSEKGCKAIIVGGTTNHIHLLVELRSTISVSNLVQFVKGSSAYIIARQKQSEVFFKWQGGYGEITVSPQKYPLSKNILPYRKSITKQGLLITTGNLSHNHRYKKHNQQSQENHLQDGFKLISPRLLPPSWREDTALCY